MGWRKFDGFLGIVKWLAMDRCICISWVHEFLDVDPDFTRSFLGKNSAWRWEWDCTATLLPTFRQICQMCSRIRVIRSSQLDIPGEFVKPTWPNRGWWCSASGWLCFFEVMNDYSGSQRNKIFCDARIELPRANQRIVQAGRWFRAAVGSDECTSNAETLQSSNPIVFARETE